MPLELANRLLSRARFVAPVSFNTSLTAACRSCRNRTLRHVSDMQPFAFADITDQVTAAGSRP